jgi:hypothetical protein
VEAMEWMATEVAARFPEIPVTDLAEIRFDKFLFLDSGPERVRAEMQLAPLPDGQLRAALETRLPLPRAGLTRVMTHASMIFGESARTPKLPDPAQAGRDLKAVPAEAIYRELVPFGPGYQNLLGDLMLGPQGALGQVRSPAQDSRRFILGSPYVLDAAFHAACVWSQRFAGTVAFPVSLDRRRVLEPTVASETYRIRAVPVSGFAGVLNFDICIYDERGKPREAAWGVRMRDVSGGRRRPPDWIVSRQAPAS